MNRGLLLSLCATTALSGTLLVGSGPSVGAEPDGGNDGPLRIMLTNDDGWRGPGGSGSDTPLIVALRNALVAAGHEVVVVAPATDQSGKGTSITQTPVTVDDPAAGVFTVTGTPRDAVNIGLDVVMKDDPPDLVISGMNPGGNYTIITNSSGTMGAATRAAERGIPAIAMSIDSLRSGDPSAVADEAAEYTVDLVAALADHKRSLGPGIALNVNYPAASAKGAKLTTVDPKPYITLSYAPVPGQDGTFALALVPSTGSPTDGSDWDALQDGFVSITPVRADPTAGRSDSGNLRYLTTVPVS